MKIVDLNMTSDALAFSISDAVRKMITEVDIVSSEKSYLIGNAADFEEFCVPAIDWIKPAGAACVWPKVTRSRIFNGFDVAVVREFVQPIPENADVIVLQAVTSTAEEIVSMITKVLRRVQPARLRLLSCIAPQPLESKLQLYFKQAYASEFKVIAEDYFAPEIDPYDFQKQAYDLLDNRVRKDFPNMPEWVLDQMKGNSFDPEPDAQPKPLPLSPSDAAQDARLEQTEELVDRGYKVSRPFR